MLAGISDSQAHRSITAARTVSLCSRGGFSSLAAGALFSIADAARYATAAVLFVYIYCSCYEAQILFASENILVVRFTDDHRLCSCVHAQWCFLTRKHIVSFVLVVVWFTADHRLCSFVHAHWQVVTRKRIFRRMGKKKS